MADASRFPQLALPFAIVGASAGWLSASLIVNPLLGFRVDRPFISLCAASVAAATGALLKRLCVGRRYGYEIGDPDPDLRPSTDRWLLHVTVVIAAGAATGALVAAVCHDTDWLAGYAVSGAICAVAFVPVCLAVIAAARRAQRARLGSIVASCDRRAVWAILTITLAAASLEALPDWPAARAAEGSAPVAVVVGLLAALAVVSGILLADRRALRRAGEVIAAGLSSHEPADADPGEAGVPQLDLGLGDGMLARFARGAAAYRQRERAVALVRGTPDLALGALRRGVRRGVIGLVVIGAVGTGHVAATTTLALEAYEERRCAAWARDACFVAAELARDRDPARARALRRRGGGEPDVPEGWVRSMEKPHTVPPERAP